MRCWPMLPFAEAHRAIPSVLAFAANPASQASAPWLPGRPTRARSPSFFSNRQKYRCYTRPGGLNLLASAGSHDDGYNPRTALLIPGADHATTVRGESIAQALSSQGFDVRMLGGADKSGEMTSAMVKELTVPRSDNMLVFDLAGRGGREMALACQEAGLAGLYAFKPATGMFQKVKSELDHPDIT